MGLSSFSYLVIKDDARGIKKQIDLGDVKVRYLPSMAGGESVFLELSLSRSKKYLLKIFVDSCANEDYHKRMDIIMGRPKSQNRELPYSLTYRGFSVGRGFISREKLMEYMGLSGNEGIIPDECNLLQILVFRYVKGSGLYERIQGEQPLSPFRRKISRQLIELLEVLDSSGIVMVDLSPDNFLVDTKGRLHIIDLESAGVLGNGRGILLKPSVLPPPIYIYPPEYEEYDRGISLGLLPIT